MSAKDLVDRGRFLRNAAPREFEAFMLAFDKYTATVFATMLTAEGPQELTRTQGHAQQCMKIQHLFGEIKNG